VISILEDNQQAKVNAEYSFAIGSIVLLFISYLIHFSLLSIRLYDNPHLFYTTKDFFVATLAFWSAHYLLDSKQYRYLWLLVWGAAICNAILISPDKTGMFITIILMLLFLFQRLSLKKLSITLLIVCSLLIGSFFVSNTFSIRINQVLSEVTTYHYGDSTTAIGQKLDRWNECLKLIRREPLFGYGTGGNNTAINQFSTGEKFKTTANSQNEYLLITSQLGILGLILYLALLIRQWLCAKKFPDKDKYLIQGIVLSMASGCVMNSFFSASHQGHFFAFLSGISFAITPRCSLAFQKSATLAGFFTG
jgi:O-antigen ligase